MGDSVFPQGNSGQSFRGDGVPQHQNLNPNSKKRIASSISRTEVCRKFSIFGNCKYGENCIFAHVSKNRSNPLEWQNSAGDGNKGRNWNVTNETTHTKGFCRFFANGRCPYGKSCIFVHQQPEMPERNWNEYRESSAISIPAANSDSVTNCRLKTRLCNHWMMSNSCDYGGKCIYAHGQAELMRSSASSLRSEFVNTRAAPTSNTRVAPTSRKKNVVPYNAGKQTDQQKVQQNIRLCNGKYLKKIVGIYADWIEDESPLASSASEQEQ